MKYESTCQFKNEYTLYQEKYHQGHCKHLIEHTEDLHVLMDPAPQHDHLSYHYLNDHSTDGGFYYQIDEPHYEYELLPYFFNVVAVILDNHDLSFINLGTTVPLVGDL